MSINGNDDDVVLEGIERDIVCSADGSTGGAVDQKIASRESSVSKGAGRLAGFRIVSLATLMSRVMGMARDIAMASAFGAGPLVDAFIVAFRVPNLARHLFGEGAQNAAFLPALVSEQEQHGERAARNLMTATSVLQIQILGSGVLLAELVLGGLWLLSLSPDSRVLVEFLMLLTPYLIFICMAAQQSTVLHSLGLFLWPALLPIVLNTVWLVAIPLTMFGNWSDFARLKWISGAILVAGALQLGIPFLALFRRGYGPTSDWRPAKSQARRVFVSMVPILLGLTVMQANTLLDSLLAWGLSPGVDGELTRSTLWSWLPVLSNGTASALYYGQRMYQFPLGVFGVALGTVLFPRFTRHAERGEYTLLRADLAAGLNLSLSIGLPAGAGLVLLATPVTRLIFERGAFSADDARMTSEMIAAYSVAVWAVVGLMVVNRAFYSVQNRLAPMRLGLWCVGVNFLLNFALLPLLGGAGLAWATSLSAIVQLMLALRLLQHEIGTLPWNSLCMTLGKTLLATGAMTVVCCATLRDPSETTLMSKLLEVGVPMIAGGGTYFAVAAAIGLREPWRLIRCGSL